MNNLVQISISGFTRFLEISKISCGFPGFWIARNFQDLHEDCHEDLDRQRFSAVSNSPKSCVEAPENMTNIRGFGGNFGNNELN